MRRKWFLQKHNKNISLRNLCNNRHQAIYNKRAFVFSPKESIILFAACSTAELSARRRSRSHSLFSTARSKSFSRATITARRCSTHDDASATAERSVSISTAATLRRHHAQDGETAHSVSSKESSILFSLPKTNPKRCRAHDHAPVSTERLKSLFIPTCTPSDQRTDCTELILHRSWLKSEAI
jgi:hypothetical protein